MTEKINTLLGFASKAGKLSFGMSAATYSAKSGKSKLLLCCRDISAKSQKEIAYHSEKFGIPYRVLDETITDMSHAVGKKCGILSVNDCGFRDSILEEDKQ